MLRGAKWYYNRVKSYIGRPRLQTQIRPVIIDERERCENPIFLLGAHRSGTSLLRRLFNSHPRIACPPETFFMADYVRMLDDPWVEQGYLGFGMDGEAMRADLARKASELHEAFRIAADKPIWADKTPQYVPIAPGIDRLYAGKARYVVIFRHPLEIVHSIWRRDWPVNDIADPFESALVYVRDTLPKLESFAASVEGRCGRIHYDRLCADPAAELAQALAAIGLDYDPAMLTFGEQQHNFGLEDPVVRGKKTIEASHGAYKSWTNAQKERALAAFGERAFEPSYWD